jgi:hypothetical protein
MRGIGLNHPKLTVDPGSYAQICAVPLGDLSASCFLRGEGMQKLYTTLAAAAPPFAELYFFDRN